MQSTDTLVRDTHGAALIDTQRYAIEALETAAGVELLRTCRESLDRLGLSVLPGFVRPQALERMRAEVLPLAERAHRRDRLRTLYSWLDNRGFDAGHPRSALTRMRQGTITNDQLPADGYMSRLYRSPALTEFVRRALGYEDLHISADPYLSLTINVLGDGDEIGWHFDANDVVVGVMLNTADEGGAYEYAPYVRSATDENYAAVSRVLASGSQRVEVLDVAPGTLYFFKGHHCIHRVTPIGATREPRLSAILCYNEAPGVVFSEATVADVFDTSSEPYLGTVA